MVDFPRKNHFGTWQFYAFGILTVVVFSGLISACQKTGGKSSADSISFSTQTISETQKPLSSVTITSFPTPSPIPSNTPQPTWTPTVQIPVSLNTPFPFSLSRITANNIKDLQQIAKFNFKQLENVYYSETNNNALIQMDKQLVSIDLDTGLTTDIALDFKGTTIPSPDFSRLVTFDTLTQVILQQENGEVVSKIEISDKSHRFYVARNQAFSPDSKYLTTVEEWGDPSNQWGAYYLYRIYDAYTGDFLFKTDTFKKPDFSSVEGFYSYSPDSLKFFVAVFEDDFVEAWDIKTGSLDSKENVNLDDRCFKSYPLDMPWLFSSRIDVSSNSLSCLLISVDGKNIVVATNKSNYVFDTSSTKQMNMLSKGQPRFSPNGKYLITDAYTSFWIWDFNKQQLVYSVGNQTVGEFSSDSSYLSVKKLRDHQVYGVAVLSIPDRQEIFNLQNYDSLTFLSDSHFALAKTSRWSSLKPSLVVNVEDGEIVHQAPDNSCDIYISNAKESLVVSCEGGNYVWDIASGTKLKDLPTGKLVWFPSKDKFIIFQGNSMLILDQSKFESVYKHQLDFFIIQRNVGTVIANAQKIRINSGTLYIPGVSGISQVDLTNFKLTDAVLLPGSTISNSHTMVAQRTERGVQILKAGKEISTLPIFSGSSILLSPDGKYLAANLDVDGIEVWDVAARIKIQTLKTGYASPITNIAFSPDEKYLLADQYFVPGYLFYVWDLSSGSMIKKYDAYRYSPVAVAKTSNRFLILDDFKIFQVYEIGLKQIDMIATFEASSENGSPTSAFSPDGAIIAYLEYSNVVFYDLKLKSFITSYQIQDNIDSKTSIEFSDDGKLFVLSGPAGLEIFGIPQNK